MITHHAFRIALAGTALLVPLSAAVAQDRPPGYPSRPVRIIVSSVPGGGLDLVARTVAQMLSDRWGQTVVVDNRPGGGAIVATDLGAKATPDGYTLLAGSDTIYILGATKRVSYDVRKAFDPVVPMTMQPYLLMIQAALPVNSVKELVAYSHGQRLRYGSSGVGTVGHLGMETFVKLSGGNFLHIPYKGGAASIVAMLGGEIHLYPGLLLSAGSSIRAGKIRPLAVMGLKRLQTLPELPTVAEQGFPGFKIVNSYNLFAPVGTPKAIVAALNRAVTDIIATPKMSQRLIAEGSQRPEKHMAPEEFRAYFLREYDSFERQVRDLKIKIY